MRQALSYLWRWGAALGLLVAAGCISRQQVYTDIHASRMASFQAWDAARRGQPSAQHVLEGDLSIDAAVLIAMGNNKQLQAMLQEKEVAKGRITEAYAEALPRLDLAASYTRLDKVASFDVAGRRVSLGDEDTYSIAATLSQPIFRGGAIGAGIRAAKLYRYFADEQVRASAQAVIFDVRRHYCDAVLASELVEVSRGDLAVARRHRAEVDKKRAQGVAADFDVLRARVEVSNVEAQLIQRENAAHLAQTSLFKAMGVSQESLVKLSSVLLYQQLDAELSECVAKAFARRPDLLLAELGVRLQREALKAARSDWWPKLDLFFTETYARPDPHSATHIAWADAWNAGVRMTLPLFDGLRTAGRVHQERAALRRRQIELVDAEEQALLDVKQAVFSLEDAEKLVQSQKDNLERAREGLRLAEAGYREGVTSEVEVLDARQALSQTQALYFQAVHAHMLAKLGLERAMGLLEPSPEGEKK